jgi:hypothetical protein
VVDAAPQGVSAFMTTLQDICCSTMSTNLSYKIRFMLLSNKNISKSILGVSVLCRTSKFKLVFDEGFVIAINSKQHSKTQYKAKFSHERLYELNTTLHKLFDQTIAAVASDYASK